MARNPRSGTSNKPAQSPGHQGEPFSGGAPSASPSGAKPNFFGPKSGKGRDVFVGSSKASTSGAGGGGRGNVWTNGGLEG